MLSYFMPSLLPSQALRYSPLSHAALRHDSSPARVGASPLRHSAKRCATSPAGGGKRTCVSFGKVCGKAKLQKVHLTTNFPFANGRKLGSPSGRAGETPARAARLRGEPPTRAGEVPPKAAERARTERGAVGRGRGIIKARTIERPGLYWLSDHIFQQFGQGDAVELGQQDEVGHGGVGLACLPL